MQQEYLKTWLSMVKTHHICSSLLSSKIKSFDLSLSQLEVLSVLFNRGNLIQKELSQRLFLSKGGISTLLNKLISLGLVNRIADNNDGRISLISLTEQGTELAKEFEVIKQVHAAEQFSSFSAEEVKQLHYLMDKIQQNLTQMHD